MNDNILFIQFQIDHSIFETNALNASLEAMRQHMFRKVLGLKYLIRNG